MPASEKTVKFLRDYYDLVDAGKVDEFMEFFAEDARLVYANNPPFEGRAAIREGLSQVLSSIAGIKHELRGIWDLADDMVLFEVDVTFSRKDGQDVQVPGAAICELRDGVMVEQRAYVDVMPVFT